MRDHPTILVRPLACQECEQQWADAHERWHLYVTHSEPAQTLLYCPACANREFGDRPCLVRSPVQLRAAARCGTTTRHGRTKRSGATLSQRAVGRVGWRVLLLACVCASALAIAAVADHRDKGRRIDRAAIAEWYCTHDGTRCGGVRSAKIERRWNEARGRLQGLDGCSGRHRRSIGPRLGVQGSQSLTPHDGRAGKSRSHPRGTSGGQAAEAVSRFRWLGNRPLSCAQRLASVRLATSSLR